MEIGVVSDIHSNLPALESVLVELDNRGIEEIICVGDIVGYYGNPIEVIEKLKSRRVIAVRGNHDDAVLTGEASGFRDSARFTVNWTRKMISPDAKQYLQSLPLTRLDKIEGSLFYSVHGSPRSPLTEYVYEEDVTEDYVNTHFTKSPDIILQGHTHQSFVKEIGNATVLNPGSVGQPRDGKHTASYAVIDTELNSAARYRTEYDIGQTIEKMEAEDLPEELSERLRKGE